MVLLYGYYYWLGSGYNNYKIWVIDTSGSFNYSCYYWGTRYIRPVIVIDTSFIE